jgi:hypothetical protein
MLMSQTCVPFLRAIPFVMGHDDVVGSGLLS